MIGVRCCPNWSVSYFWTAYFPFSCSIRYQWNIINFLQPYFSDLTTFILFMVDVHMLASNSHKNPRYLWKTISDLSHIAIKNSLYFFNHFLTKCFIFMTYWTALFSVLLLYVPLHNISLAYFQNTPRYNPNCWYKEINIFATHKSRFIYICLKDLFEFFVSLRALHSIWWIMVVKSHLMNRFSPQDY